jgi:mono/diheme cytochrome c family protein
MLIRKLMFAVMFVLLLAAGAVQAGGDVARGQELSVDCADCHGDDGKGDEDNPPVAGWLTSRRITRRWQNNSKCKVLNERHPGNPGAFV